MFYEYIFEERNDYKAGNALKMYSPKYLADYLDKHAKKGSFIEYKDRIWEYVKYHKYYTNSRAYSMATFNNNGRRLMRFSLPIYKIYLIKATPLEKNHKWKQKWFVWDRCLNISCNILRYPPIVESIPANSKWLIVRDINEAPSYVQKKYIQIRNYIIETHYYIFNKEKGI